MTAILWQNIPLAMLFVLAFVGIPLWMVNKRPDRAPDHSEAQAYLAAKAGGRRAPVIPIPVLAERDRRAA
jgi:hypothetical protein